MKKRKAFFIFCILMLVCAGFSTCKNPVIEKWWGDEEEEDFNYVAMIKDVPYLVYETIIEKEYIYEEIKVSYPEYVILPPEILMQHIDIKGIEFILFSGDQTKYNWSAKNPAITHLTVPEQTTNNEIINDMVSELKTNDGTGGNPTYYLILHGHANPVFGTAAETAELNMISTGRANSAFDALKSAYNSNLTATQSYSSGPIGSVGSDGLGPNYPPGSTPPADFTDRVTTKGYGGGRNLSGPSSTYAGLNRRVEAILFTVEIDTVPQPKELGR